MPRSLTHRARFFWGSVVLGIVVVVTLAFWGFELRQTLRAQAAYENEVLTRHQERLLEQKAAEIHDLFDEIYQNARTISLLPAVREVSGRNRSSAGQDPVRLGRLLNDTHRTLQQLYTNLQTYIRISEIYYVLDGFAPERGEVPFFMYDDRIVGRASGKETPAAPETEEHEYVWLVKELDWFRKNEPTFRYTHDLHLIPVRVSPLMRTCDNTQFPAENSNPRDIQGFIHALPVYDLHSQRFKGMIATVVRANQIEAKLNGVPFLPLSAAEKEQAVSEGWTLPEKAAAFVLTERNNGLEISDRRHPLLGAGLELARAKGSGRWAQMPLKIEADGQWTLHHYLAASEVDTLLAESRRAGTAAVAARFLLLALLAGLFSWGTWFFLKSRRELMWMAHYDSLTELPNRRLFFDRLQGSLARARRQGTRVALFYVDVADLNAVNDTYGHHAGDQLLVELATRFRVHLRGSDSVFRGQIGRLTQWRDPLPVISRLGGDEFTILCEDVTSEDGLIAISEQIMGAVRAPFVVEGNQIEIRLNVGATVFPDDADESDGGERLLMCADSAMNECKQNRLGGFVLFNEKTRARVERQHALAVELQMALQRDQFKLFYQPKASLRDGKVLSMEALLRWQHPVFGIVRPDECIPILERSGGIVAVGEWVIEQACRDLNRFTAAGYPEMRVGVNVSMQQLRRSDFHETVATVLARFAVEPQRMILEITESMAMEDMEQGSRALEKLKELGVSLSIDDFGAGYSSLTYLQRLPINSLKLDKGLIDGMIDERSIHVVQSVIRLAQGLSLKTIAEGVETESQRSELFGMGCDIMQGFLLSEPLPFDQIIEWLANRR